MAHLSSTSPEFLSDSLCVSSAHNQPTLWKWFEVFQTVENEKIGVSDILSALTCSIPEHELRTILLLGLRQCLETFDVTNPIIHNVHTALSSLHSRTHALRSSGETSCHALHASRVLADATTTTASDGNCTHLAQKQVLESDDLVLKILQFVSLGCKLRRMGRVSLRWLRLCLDSSAYYSFANGMNMNMNMNMKMKMKVNNDANENRNGMEIDTNVFENGSKQTLNVWNMLINKKHRCSRDMSEESEIVNENRSDSIDMMNKSNLNGSGTNEKNENNEMNDENEMKSEAKKNKKELTASIGYPLFLNRLGLSDLHQKQLKEKNFMKRRKIVRQMAPHIIKDLEEIKEIGGNYAALRREFAPHDHILRHLYFNGKKNNDNNNNSNNNNNVLSPNGLLPNIPKTLNFKDMLKKAFGDDNLVNFLLDRVASGMFSSDEEIVPDDLIIEDMRMVGQMEQMKVEWENFELDWDLVANDPQRVPVIRKTNCNILFLKCKQCEPKLKLVMRILPIKNFIYCPWDKEIFKKIMQTCDKSRLRKLVNEGKAYIRYNKYDKMMLGKDKNYKRKSPKLWACWAEEGCLIFVQEQIKITFERFMRAFCIDKAKFLKKFDEIDALRGKNGEEMYSKMKEMFINVGVFLTWECLNIVVMYYDENVRIDAQDNSIENLAVCLDDYRCEMITIDYGDSKEAHTYSENPRPIKRNNPEGEPPDNQISNIVKNQRKANGWETATIIKKCIVPMKNPKLQPILDIVAKMTIENEDERMGVSQAAQELKNTFGELINITVGSENHRLMLEWWRFLDSSIHDDRGGSCLARQKFQDMFE